MIPPSHTSPEQARVTILMVRVCRIMAERSPPRLGLGMLKATSEVRPLYGEVTGKHTEKLTDSSFQETWEANSREKKGAAVTRSLCCAWNLVVISRG